MPDSAELLRLYAENRSETAFAELVRRHIDLVYAKALRHLNGDVHLAEDVTQSVFTDLATKAQSVSRRPSVAGWLYRSTHFAAAAAVRTESRRRIREEKAHLMHELHSDDPAKTDWTDLRPALDRAMDRLSDGDRDALMLRYFEEKPLAEVGQILRLSDNAARMRIERALEKLRRLLAARGVTSTAAALAVLLTSRPSAAAPSGMATAVAGKALASAAVAVPSAFSLLPLMSTTKTSIGVGGFIGLAAFLCLPFLGVAIHELRTARRASASLALADEAYRTAQAQLRQLERSAAGAGGYQAKTLNALNQLPVPVPTNRRDPAGPAANRVSRNQKADGQKFLATFPQARAMLLELGRAQFASLYAPFYRSASLTPAQIDEFESKAAESWLQNFSLTPGGSSDLPNVSNIPQDQLQQILGDQAFQQIQDYKRMTVVESWVGQMATAVAYSATPLSADQADQLVDIIAVNGSRNGPDLDSSSIDWDIVQTQAKEVLTSSQWTAAKSALLALQYNQALEQAQHSNAVGSGAANPP